jgi:inhibitor of KinA
MNVRFLHSGDTALVVEFGDRIDAELSERVLHLSVSVRMLNLPGIIETVPTFRSLFVLYDPVTIDCPTLISTIERLLDASSHPKRTSRLWRIPACYESRFGPDLNEIAERTGHTAEEIVGVHGATQFHVYMIGFVPGHPYMGDLPNWLALPRRIDPRIKVPAGSIGIANALSVVYPVDTPGGWHLIGATPVRLFDADAVHPSLLSPGDKVKFEPVTTAQFNTIRQEIAAGRYKVPSQIVDP